MKVECEFWMWKLSDVEVLFKVDGVSVWLIGEVVNGCRRSSSRNSKVDTNHHCYRGG